MMKVRLLMGLACLCGLGARAQTLTLEQAQLLAREHYPLKKEKELIEKTGQYTLENIAKGMLPQLAVNGQATFQSAVTEIPIHLPNQSVPHLSKDQYRLYAEAVQPITDLFSLRKELEVEKARVRNNADVLEVELYALHERINNLFFGALLLEEQDHQNMLTGRDVELAVRSTRSAVENGADYAANLDKLLADSINIQQRGVELRSKRRSLLAALAIFIGQPLSDTTRLERPILAPIMAGAERPEMRVFRSKLQVMEGQNKLLQTHLLPKFSVFVQGGVGRPALNMLSNEFEPYYLAGVRLNWPLQNWYTYKREQKILVLKRQTVSVRNETFLFDQSISVAQQKEDLLKYDSLLAQDVQLIELRTAVKTAATSQLLNGAITVNDFLKEVYLEEAARQQRALHVLQQLQASYMLSTTIGY